MSQTIINNNEQPAQGQISPEAAIAAAGSEASHGVAHEITLYAEPVAHIGSFTVTNALLNSWVTVVLILILSLLIRRSLRRVPGMFQSFVETIIEGALKLADSVTGDRKKTMKVFPAVFSVFVFILINNWLGLVPGVGSIGFIEEHAGTGALMFVPLLRGATADLNTTLALAIFSVVGSNIFGIVAVGAWRYFNKFVNVKALGAIPGRIRREPMIALVNPITFFVGLIEIIGEIAKVASLSFRLFGNIFAGEVLLVSLAAIFAYVLPIPFMFLEIIVGLIQALIFAMLTLVYFTVASQDHDHEEEHHGEERANQPVAEAERAHS